MTYLSRIDDEETKVDAMSTNESDILVGRYVAFAAGIRKRGHNRGGEALQAAQAARVIRIRNGKGFTTDGPFAETKEHGV